MQNSDPSSSSPPVDTAPFLHRTRRFLRRAPPPFRSAARFFRRASGRRMMLREPSVRVREAAAAEVEERQSEWAYSRPVVALDVAWNVAFLAIGATVLGLSAKEEPRVPLRAWIVGYLLQGVLHSICVLVEFTRRRRTTLSGSDVGDHVEWSFTSESDQDFYASDQFLEGEGNRLCITFLAFDVVIVLICVAVACLIGIAVCCCLPCILAVLCVVADQEGATKEEIDQLPKYKFRMIKEFKKGEESFRGIMTESDSEAATEHVVALEDAVS
ncbi:E3 ubiquitin-protein ligase, partial [Mucuna pruriens]